MFNDVIGWGWVVGGLEKFRLILTSASGVGVEAALTLTTFEFTNLKPQKFYSDVMLERKDQQPVIVLYQT